MFCSKSNKPRKQNKKYTIPLQLSGSTISAILVDPLREYYVLDVKHQLHISWEFPQASGKSLFRIYFLQFFVSNFMKEFLRNFHALCSIYIHYPIPTHSMPYMYVLG